MKTDTVIDEHLTNEVLKGQISFDDTYDYNKMRDSNVKEKLEILNEMAGSLTGKIGNIDAKEARMKVRAESIEHEKKVEKRLRALDGLADSAPAGIPDDIDIRQIRIERALKRANYG